MVDKIYFVKPALEMLLVVSSQPLIENSSFQGWIGIASLITGGLGILVSIFLGIFFYRIGRSLKLITYEILADTPIMSIPVQAKTGEIKIIYEDTTGHQNMINDAKILSLKIRNSGNQDVQIWHSGNTDITNMEEPIEFEFEGRTVICLTQVKTEPLTDVITDEQFRIYISNPLPAPSILGLPRCLLKANQSILISVLLKGTGRKIKRHGKLFNGNVENNRDLEKRKQSLQRRIFISLALGLAASFLGIALLFPSIIVFISLSATVFAVILTFLNAGTALLGAGHAIFDSSKRSRD